jgi:hypothetical protein
VTRLPSSPQRPQPRQNSTRLRPKTYSIAVYVIAAILLLQVVMVISVFWLRAMVVPVNFTRPTSQHATSTVVVKPATPNLNPAPVPGPGEMPNLAAPGRQTLLALPTATDKRTQIGNLLDEAQMLRRQNDLKNAVATLIRAEDLDARNPEVLQALAETYYMLNDSVRSKIYWQRLVDLGPAVGRVYTLARDHVLLLNSTPEADVLEAPSVLGRTVYVDNVEKTPVETLNGVPQFHVRTVLMRKDAHMNSFDQKKLQPYVIFYQQMPDGTLTPDLREHKGAFEDTFLFWNKKLKEAFSVDYALPTPGATGPNQAPLGEYYGFVIGIYYDKTLQDACSEPADLITRLPLPDAIE